jgi:hypothetical protein
LKDVFKLNLCGDVNSSGFGAEAANPEADLNRGIRPLQLHMTTFGNLLLFTATAILLNMFTN